MVETAWVYAISTASAAFVAIVGALFTSKILGISSRKSEIINQVKLYDAELGQREPVAASYQESIDAIYLKWARERISDWFRDLIRYWKETSVPDNHKLRELYEIKKERQMSRHEVSVFEEEYSKIKAELESVASENARYEEAVRNPSTATSAMATRAMAEAVRSMGVGIIPLDWNVKQERKDLDELEAKLEEQSSIISVLKSKREELNEQLKTMSSPKYLEFGLFTLIYFAVVGICVPLGFVLFNVPLSFAVSLYLFAIFVSGLFANFLYIIVEVRYATTK